MDYLSSDEMLHKNDSSFTEARWWSCSPLLCDDVRLLLGICGPHARANCLHSHVYIS